MVIRLLYNLCYFLHKIMIIPNNVSLLGSVEKMQEWAGGIYRQRESWREAGRDGERDRNKCRTRDGKNGIQNSYVLKRQI